MPERMHRAQILLEPEQHKAIREIAEKENRSISDVVRDIVQQYLEKMSKETRFERERQALEGLRKIREEIESSYGVYQGDLVAEVREEREKQMDEAQRARE